ncbi:MAG: hypothetical protein P1U32_07685 [Legionellaceae bacterium]|nr:hypothetical protein [Legionellaceae bacterium]
MRKHLKCILFCISTLLAIPALAVEETLLQAGASVDLQLKPNEPQVFSNVFRWTIDADCTVIKSDETTVILFKILRKQGTMNDITLKRGESLRLQVAQDETFHIIAIPGATIELTNEGEDTAIARCVASNERLK